MDKVIFEEKFTVGPRFKCRFEIKDGVRQGVLRLFVEDFKVESYHLHRSTRKERLKQGQERAAEIRAKLTPEKVEEMLRDEIEAQQQKVEEMEDDLRDERQRLAQLKAVAEDRDVIVD